MNKMTRETKPRSDKQMKISQLCDESGVKRSTIHYYLKMGLLDPPKKVGLSLFIYGDTHLTQLRQIRQLREQENLPLPLIKEIIQQHEMQPGAPPLDIMDRQLADQKKEQILNVATELFSKKGYDKTTISEIADALSMGRSTFYQYFKDKREVFIECIERLTLVIVPQESWNDIRNEKDPVRRAHVRVLAFQKAFPDFRGILNLLRHALTGDDPLLVQKARETFRSLIQPLVKDFHRAVEMGTFREMDVELTNYFALALCEMLGFRLMMDDQYTVDEGVKKLIDFLNYGILARRDNIYEKNTINGFKGQITDEKGLTTQLQDIRFDKTHTIVGRLGSAEVQVEIENIDLFNIKKNSAVCQMEVKMMDGQRVTLEVSKDITLTGQTPFGKFKIPLKAISKVSFDLSGQ